MKGLERIPSIQDLAKAYDHLLEGKVESDTIALWSQWSRFDPRLAEILVAYIARHWKTFDLFELRSALLKRPWPQAFGVLVENAIAARLISRREVSLFRRWANTILSGVEPASGELFFFGTRKIGGSAMALDASASSKTYSRWGYLGRDLLVNKADTSILPSQGSTTLSRSTRERLRDDLARKLERFTVHDYQAALEYRVSRRQAELDLARDPKIRAVGNTRARFYRKK